MTLRLVIAALAILAAAHPAAHPPDEPPIVLKFSHVVAEDTPKGQAAELFKRRAEELTEGRVRVEVYPEGTLHGDKDEFEALQLGAVQMLAPSLSKFGRLGLTEFEVFDLPFMFSGYPEVHVVTGGRIGRRLFQRLETKGIRGLAWWDAGFKSFSANRPLRSVEDYCGLRLRIQPSLVLDAQVRALGAQPQVIGFSDVEAALRAGVVDGAENPISNLYRHGMHEVQKHVALTRHGYLGYAVIVNERFWSGLPADVRRKLGQALREATAHANRLAEAQDRESLAKVAAAGTTEIHEPTADERLALKRALVPVHQQMMSRIGKELITEIYEATRFDPDAP